jgi:hypothetical protein
VNATTTPYWETPYLSRTRSKTTQAGTLEFLFKFSQNMSSLTPLSIVLPFKPIRCSQFMCIWDKSPWYDNKKDNWIPTECEFFSANNTLMVQIFTLVNNTVIRLIISSMNAADGNQGLLMPSSPGFYPLIITGNLEMV